MRSLNSFLLLCLIPCAHAATFAILGPQAGSWPAVLSAVGHIAGPSSAAEIFVAPPGTPASADWKVKVQDGAALILEGSSPLADSFGFRPRSETISVVHLVDEHNPALPVIWNQAVNLPRYDIPESVHRFAKDRWTGSPLIAGERLGKGAILWVAISPGTAGYERFPYLMQALAGLGFEPGVRSSRLWAFFDYSYRTRADPDYLAVRWRKSGIAAVHVASWHFYEPDPERDKYLAALIEAAHQHGVLVYAWVELPHVSEQFWNDHPEWREQTALLQDAQLDWRKLMNLQNPDCTSAIRAGLRSMMERFDWDGVNLAELYFESLEGAGNPSRFTPLNTNVREDFKMLAGWDPLEIWHGRSEAPALRQFLDFRASLARRMQEDWLNAVESFRTLKPDLDIVLTHVDDRFDTGMKDSIGADAAAVLPMLANHQFSFLIEDPATVWNLGPQRYPEIAKRYQPLTAHTDKLAIDINIVDRYQDVYPTKQQTGTELFQLVHLASAAFPRVALYFENSILKPDLALLAASSAVVTAYSGGVINSVRDVELIWNSEGALVDGKPWPVLSSSVLRLPAGRHTVAPAGKRQGLALIDLNATLVRAGVEGKRIVFEYTSDSRAIALFDRKPAHIEVDGTTVLSSESVMLPRGQHTVTAN